MATSQSTMANKEVTNQNQTAILVINQQTNPRLRRHPQPEVILFQPVVIKMKKEFDCFGEVV